MGRAYATETSKKGWIIPVAIQFIPPLMYVSFWASGDALRTCQDGHTLPILPRISTLAGPDWQAFSSRPGSQPPSTKA